MKSLFTISILLTAFCAGSLTSCQPEVDPLPNQRVDSTGGLLVKVDCRHGADTMSVIFFYDAQKRWNGLQAYVFLDGELIVNNKGFFARDAAGYIIQGISVDSSDYPQVYERDTVILFHDPVTGHYTRSFDKSTQYLLYNSTINNSTDTFNYIYNNQGQIIAKTVQYDRTNTLGLDTSRFTFGGLNLIKHIDIFGFTSDHDSTVLQFDTKISPYSFGNEALLFSIPYLYSTNNVTVFTQISRNRTNGQGVLEYTFNAAGKPTKAVLTALPSNEKFTFNYHYQ